MARRRAGKEYLMASKSSKAAEAAETPSVELEEEAKVVATALEAENAAEHVSEAPEGAENVTDNNVEAEEIPLPGEKISARDAARKRTAAREERERKIAEIQSDLIDRSALKDAVRKGATFDVKIVSVGKVGKGEQQEVVLNGLINGTTRAKIGFFDYDWINYNAVEFVDGTAEIQVSGAFRYQVYSTIRVIILSTSFLVFLLIILLGIRKKIVYIRELSDEVEVLEGGGLHHPITVRGSDELSALAEGLETMRTSFLESQKKEEWVVRENRRIITEMSHDLRTPCTSIILYAEILLNGKCEDERQQKKYLEKILLKAYQIKERSDRLLGFSISRENRKEQVLEKGAFSEVFYDLLSEMCGYLEQNGFTVKLNTLLPEVEITYNMDHVVRIMDNIASNIVKYADPEYPVMITQTGGDNKELDNTVGLRFHNRIARPETAPEGFNIGVQSVSSLMKEMGGSCRFEQNGDAYCIEILFNFRNEYVG